MGDNRYEGDVAQRIQEAVTRRRSGGADFGFVPKADRPAERKVHDELNPKGKIRECCDNPTHPLVTPIVVGMDVTDSRGDDVETMFIKVPRLIGKTYSRALVPDPTISYCGIGDATCDLAPLQVGQFEAGNELDQVLSEFMWLEKGGGGTGQESYELAAYYYARKIKVDAFKRGQKGYFFFTADESPYPLVKKSEVKRVIGDNLQADIPTGEIFAELQQNFHTFLIFIKKPWEIRQQHVDKEIEKRVKEAGGLHSNVDVRFSLIWQSFNDLDLHVQTPDGEHIYFGYKQSSCGGELDVDRNAGGRETRKPVENTRWKKGTAPKGTYQVWVENFAFHEDTLDETPFKVEISIGGKIQSFEGVCERGRTSTNSRVDVGSFYFDPEAAKQKQQTDQPDKYAAYQDDVILAEWSKLLPAENIIILNDPKGIVDAMLGVLALKGGTRNLKEFLADLKEDEQTEERIADIKQALKPLSDACKTEKIKVEKGSKASTVKRRGKNLIDLK